MDEKLLNQIRIEIDNLYFEYDRMSHSGKKTLDKLADLISLDSESLTKAMKTEVWGNNDE
jgi:hypothetical protein